MVIHIQVPQSYPAERDYIVKVLFGEFLGLETYIERSNRQDILITTEEKGQVIISDGLFGCPTDIWLKKSSLPSRPLQTWDTREFGQDLPLVNPKIPVIYGNPLVDGKWIKQDRKSIHLGLDIFGSAFFMLTRYEEVVKSDKDNHGRFPAISSLAYQEGFLDRPIVNEYLELLWACLKRLWPHLERRKREFQILVSHDVDVPFSYLFKSPFQLLRNCAGDIFLRHQVIDTIRRALRWKKVKKGNLTADPYNTFDLIMGITERKGLRSTFNFLTDRLCQLDSNYSIHNPRIRELLRRIHDRGHSIGLHASYHSYRNGEQTKKEFNTLKQVCEQEGIEQDRWGIRQHYLRVQIPITLRNLNDAGLDYDSTLSFADHAGFRCGICYEYPFFDVIKKETLRLLEIPLIVMDCTITDDKYMGLGNGEKAFVQIKRLKDTCRIFDGDFTLLWHNSRFVDPLDIALYEKVIGD